MVFSTMVKVCVLSGPKATGGSLASDITMVTFVVSVRPFNGGWSGIEAQWLGWAWSDWVRVFTSVCVKGKVCVHGFVARCLVLSDCLQGGLTVNIEIHNAHDALGIPPLSRIVTQMVNMSSWVS